MEVQSPRLAATNWLEYWHLVVTGNSIGGLAVEHGGGGVAMPATA